jgi:bifunctional DNA-binding transcriptional regulator/antitoxin component of YhaV-PrlF toxin-antitoxin module
MKERKVQRINSTFWISIPKHICDDMGIQKNTILECGRKGNKIIFEKKDMNHYENGYMEEHENSGAD